MLWNLNSYWISNFQTWGTDFFTNNILWMIYWSANFSWRMFKKNINISPSHFGIKNIKLYTVLYNTNIYMSSTCTIFHFHPGRYHIVVYVLWPYAIPICISVLYSMTVLLQSPPLLARISFMTSPIFRIEHTSFLCRNRAKKVWQCIVIRCKLFFILIKSAWDNF